MLRFSRLLITLRPSQISVACSKSIGFFSKLRFKTVVPLTMAWVNNFISSDAEISMAIPSYSLNNPEKQLEDWTLTF